MSAAIQVVGEDGVYGLGCEGRRVPRYVDSWGATVHVMMI